MLKFIAILCLAIFGVGVTYQLLSPSPVSQNTTHVPEESPNSTSPAKTLKEVKKEMPEEAPKPDTAALPAINAWRDALKIAVYVVVCVGIVVVFVYLILNTFFKESSPKENSNTNNSINGAVGAQTNQIKGSLECEQQGFSGEKKPTASQKKSLKFTQKRKDSQANTKNVNSNKQDDLNVVKDKDKKAFGNSNDKNLLSSANQGNTSKDNNQYTQLSPPTLSSASSEPLLSVSGDTITIGLEEQTEGKRLNWFNYAQKGDKKSLAQLYSEDNINAKDQYGKTALLLSAQEGHLDCLKYLVQQGAYIHDRDNCQYTALILSAQKGHLDCLKYFVQQSADIHARDDCQYTALIWSAQEGHLDCLKYLVQQGAAIDAKNKWGDTALLRSAENGHGDCLKYLVQQNADINAKNNDSKTALIWSAFHGYEAIVKLLVDSHANIDDIDKGGETALIWSVNNGNLTLVKYLVEEGRANINAKNKWGKTALIGSVRCKHQSIVTYLLQKDADITCKYFDKTALGWAETEEIKQILIKKAKKQ